MKYKVLIILLFMGIYVFPAIAQQKKIVVGITTKSLVTQDENSGYASILEWAKKYLGKRSKLTEKKLAWEWFLFENNVKLNEFMSGRNVDIVGMRSLEYLMWKEKKHYKPVLSVGINNSENVEYCLVCSKTPTGKKNLAIETFYPQDLNYIWLQTKINSEKKQKINSFFSAINLYDSEAEALLSVFFGNNEYAVISKAKLEIMEELNPQIAKKISVLYTSPQYVHALVAFSEKLDKSIVNLFIDESMSVGEEDEGKQILDLFKVTKVEKLDENSLKNLEELLNEYRKFENIK